MLEKVLQFLAAPREVHLVVLNETRAIPHSMALHLSLIYSTYPDAAALFHYHLPPFHSSRLFTHEYHYMYARFRVADAIGRSTLWQDQSPMQTNPPPR